MRSFHCDTADYGVIVVKQFSIINKNISVSVDNFKFYLVKLKKGTALCISIHSSMISFCNLTPKHYEGTGHRDS